MPKQLSKKDHTNSRNTLIKISKLHLIVDLVFALQTIIYDAGKLITPEVVLKRWIFIGIFAVGAAIVWYLARINNDRSVIKKLVWFLITVDLVLASFSVYSQRGMASRAVILFLLPILVAACLHRWGSIFITSVVAIVVYIVTAVAYFVLNFNEGYKLELYGEILFYSALILIFSRVIWFLVKQKH